MKHKWQHPAPAESSSEGELGKRYWRGASEYEAQEGFEASLTQEFANQEAGAADTLTEEEQEKSRRDFMKLMGAATSLAGLGVVSCRRPEKYLVPYAKAVEWVIPGKPTFYTTTIPSENGAIPAVVTTHEGRPTHLQGNPDHPDSNGSLDSRATSTILDLYSPNRQKAVQTRSAGKLNNVKPQRFQEKVDSLRKSLEENRAEGAAIVLSPEALQSPTTAALAAELAEKYSGLRLFSYSPISYAARDEVFESYLGRGKTLNPVLDKARRVLSLGSDFLGLEAPSATAVSDFMKGRKVDINPDLRNQMNRLYVVENRYTLTGGMADHRLPIPASQIPALSIALARIVAERTGHNGLRRLLRAAKIAPDTSNQEWLKEVAADLLEHRGKSLILAGAEQSAEVHALALGMNQALSAFGSTLSVVSTALSPSAKLSPRSIEDLQRDIADNKISTLFLTGRSDLVFASSGTADWADLLEAVRANSVSGKKGEVLQICHTPNSSSEHADWLIPANHYLESWGDARTAGGAYSIIQPMIEPLYGGLSENDLLLLLLGKKDIVSAEEGNDQDPALAAVENTFNQYVGGDWKAALRDGFAAGSATVIEAPQDASALLEVLSAAPVRSNKVGDGFELVLVPDHKLWDGRYADNAWLQETPDPITKITWDNVAQLSPRTFRELGLRMPGYNNEKYPMIRVSVGGQSLEIPAIEAPGHAHRSITIPLGYGQKAGGEVAENRGFNAYPLLSGDSMILEDVQVEVLKGRSYPLAITAEHYSMEGRALVREGKLDRYLSNDSFAKHEGMDHHIPENISLYHGQIGRKTEDNPKGFDYELEHQWGMTIDLNQCIGCTACLSACQSENNIPVVGKDQVIKHREMHWIRMDRYFATTDNVDDDPSLDELDNPEMLPQPVACVHCESAPCETVCPVNATVHTPEGLNSMAYNRCIGTRYCANNCPYKARRFNFFDYNKRNVLSKKGVGPFKFGNLYAGPFGERADSPVSKLQKNPNVTVRMRGVMEKCTYCVQRLEEAKIDQKIVARDSKNVRVPADKVKVACQQACPADAIVFGDLANEDSAVVQSKLSPRNYDLLSYIGTMPRTSYLARIKNPNMKMPGSAKVGSATEWMH